MLPGVSSKARYSRLKPADTTRGKVSVRSSAKTTTGMPLCHLCKLGLHRGQAVRRASACPAPDRPPDLQHCISFQVKVRLPPLELGTRTFMHLQGIDDPVSCWGQGPDPKHILAKTVCLTDLVHLSTPRCFLFTNYLILSDSPVLQHVSIHWFLAHALLGPALPSVTPAPCKNTLGCGLFETLNLCKSTIFDQCEGIGHARCSGGQLLNSLGKCHDQRSWLVRSTVHISFGIASPAAM